MCRNSFADLPHSERQPILNILVEWRCVAQLRGLLLKFGCSQTSLFRSLERSYAYAQPPVCKATNRFLN